MIHTTDSDNTSIFCLRPAIVLSSQFMIYSSVVSNLKILTSDVGRTRKNGSKFKMPSYPELGVYGDAQPAPKGQD